ncbi:ABC transporter substrate-binding protein [Vibrio methylphosphonaticus]|uniref:ABC transporter substrate-binding protein n=1 Tax=Vibrio methylphosphonaticus TaxID=2946866 RepID=UPI00202ABBBC|nr:ABC transporter substrate-binding protein [Vibrio methylphosphonaticus]MCL9775661.1 ABC transporter substrate-binding protein [Vibrio methylphosphonaticus]
MKLRLSTVALSLVTASSIAKPVQVDLWHNQTGDAEAVLQSIINDFNAAHEGVEVNATYNGKYADIITKLQASIPARRNPDMAVLEVTQYGVFAEAEVLTDLNHYYDSNLEFTEQLQPFAKEIGNYKDGNYIMPFNSSTPLMYVNKALLAKAGIKDLPAMTDFDQILEVAKTVQNQLGSENIYGINTPSQFTRFALVMQNGGDWVDPVTNESGFNNQRTIDAFQWMGDLYHKHRVASAESVTDEKMVKQHFSSGRVAIHFDSTGNLGDYKRALGDNLAVLPMPCTVECRVPIGGAGIGMLANIGEEKQKASWQFMQYLASAEPSAKWFQHSGYMPVNTQALELSSSKELLQDQKEFAAAMDQLPVAQGRARPPAMAWIRSQESGVWESIALGMRSADDALKAFHSRVESRL